MIICCYVGKNKYVKHTHISEAKFRQIILLFSEDLSATQISHLTKISRPTVNKYLTAIRLRILELMKVILAHGASAVNAAVAPEAKP
jgi:transposase